MTSRTPALGPASTPRADRTAAAARRIGIRCRARMVSVRLRVGGPPNAGVRPPDAVSALSTGGATQAQCRGANAPGEPSRALGSVREGLVASGPRPKRGRQTQAETPEAGSYPVAA